MWSLGKYNDKCISQQCISKNITISESDSNEYIYPFNVNCNIWKIHSILRDYAAYYFHVVLQSPLHCNDAWPSITPPPIRIVSTTALYTPYRLSDLRVGAFSPYIITKTFICVHKLNKNLFVLVTALCGWLQCTVILIFDLYHPMLPVISLWL